MDPAIIVGILALAGTAITAYGASAGTKGSAQNAFTDDLLQRVNELEKITSELRQDFDAERGLRIKWENYAWDQNRLLKRGLDVLSEVAQWLRAGAHPPPEVDRAIAEIEATIDAIK